MRKSEKKQSLLTLLVVMGLVSVVSVELMIRVDASIFDDNLTDE